MKKFVSTAIAALTVMSLVSGCTGGGANKPTGQSSDATPTTATSTKEEDTEVKLTAAGAPQLKSKPIADLTPCTITVGGLNDVTTSGMETTGIGKKIAELTGITVSLIDVDPTKLTTLAASGDLPDILYIGDSTGQITKSLANSGNLTPIDELLQTRGQNILNRAKDGIDMLKSQTNDITYVIPTGITSLNTEDPTYNGGNGFYTRYDLYTGAGAPEVKGMDSFLDALVKMQEKYPTSPTGKKAYALSAWTDWGLWPYFNIIPGLMGYDGLVANQRVDRYTGDWTSSFLDPQSNFWISMEFYFKANQLGIFDPDGLTQGWNQLGTKIANGEVYTSCAGNWSVPDKAVCGEEAGLFMLPGSFPVVASLFTPESKLGWGFANCRAITTACENPERAMDLLNFFDSDEGSRLLFDGVQGTDWDYVDGVPLPIGEYLSARLGTGAPTYIADNGMGCLQYLSSSTSFTTSDGYLNNLIATTGYFNIVMEQDKAAQKFVEANKNGDDSITYPGKVYASLANRGIMQNNLDFPWPSFSGLVTGSDEFTKAEANAETYITGRLGELILAKDQATFNKVQSDIIAALKARGLEKAEAEIIQKWQSAKEQLQPQVVKQTKPLDRGFDVIGMNSAQ